MLVRSKIWNIIVVMSLLAKVKDFVNYIQSLTDDVNNVDVIESIGLLEEVILQIQPMTRPVSRPSLKNTDTRCNTPRDIIAPECETYSNQETSTPPISPRLSKLKQVILTNKRKKLIRWFNKLPENCKINPQSIVYSANFVLYKKDMCIIREFNDLSTIEFIYQVTALSQCRKIPYVSKLLGIYVDDIRTLMITEYCTTFNPIGHTDSQKIEWVTQLCIALNHIHSFDTPLTHGNICTENIKILNNEIRLCNFENTDKCVKDDIYDLGVLIYYMITNSRYTPPFSLSPRNVRNQCLMKLAEKCLSENINDRPTAAEILIFLTFWV